MALTLRLFISAALVSVLIGCTSVAKLGPLPSVDGDYLLAKQDLVNKFPEIEKYEYQLEEIHTITFLGPVHVETLEPPDRSYLPRKDDVLAVFGKPYVIKGGYITHAVLAGLLMVGGIDPVTSVAIPLLGDPTYYRRYFFEKGKYCIEATFTRTYKTKYVSLMKGWQWHEKSCNEL